MQYKCPVCGHMGLDDPTYDNLGHGSDEICQCCGFQFGYDDFPDKEAAYIDWRQKWVKDGMTWFSSCGEAPKNWDPSKQLQAL